MLFHFLVNIVISVKMKSYQYVQLVIILMFLCEPENVASMSLEEKNELR